MQKLHIQLSLGPGSNHYWKSQSTFESTCGQSNRCDKIATLFSWGLEVSTLWFDGLSLLRTSSVLLPLLSRKHLIVLRSLRNPFSQASFISYCVNFRTSMPNSTRNESTQKSAFDSLPLRLIFISFTFDLAKFGANLTTCTVSKSPNLAWDAYRTRPIKPVPSSSWFTTS